MACDTNEVNTSNPILTFTDAGTVTCKDTVIIGAEDNILEFGHEINSGLYHVYLLEIDAPCSIVTCQPPYYGPHSRRGADPIDWPSFTVTDNDYVFP